MEIGIVGWVSVSGLGFAHAWRDLLSKGPKFSVELGALDTHAHFLVVWLCPPSCHPLPPASRSLGEAVVGTPLRCLVPAAVLPTPSTPLVSPLSCGLQLHRCPQPLFSAPLLPSVLPSLALDPSTRLIYSSLPHSSLPMHIRCWFLLLALLHFPFWACLSRGSGSGRPQQSCLIKLLTPACLLSQPRSKPL